MSSVSLKIGSRGCTSCFFLIRIFPANVAITHNLLKIMRRYILVHYRNKVVTSIQTKKVTVDVVFCLLKVRKIPNRHYAGLFTSDRAGCVAHKNNTVILMGETTYLSKDVKNLFNICRSSTIKKVAWILQC